MGQTSSKPLTVLKNIVMVLRDALSDEHFREGDVLISGTMREGANQVESPPDLHLEALYGRVALANGGWSDQAMHAALIIVPPQGTVWDSYAYPDDFPRPWIHPVVHVLKPQYRRERGDLPLVEGENEHITRFQIDGRRKTISIEGNRFDLTQGKYFVVSYDADWKSTTLQLDNELQNAPFSPETVQLLKEQLLT